MAWAPDYVTSTELKAYMRISDAVDDAELGFAISAASRAIDVDANRQFGVVAAPEERWFTGEWDRRRCRWIIIFDDLMAVTGFDPQVQDADGVDVGAIDDYVLEPRNAAVKARPWTQMMVRPDSTYKPTGLRDEISITALWGWTSVPTAVKEATLLQASRFAVRRDSPYGVAGSPDQGSELRLLQRVDPDVSVALRDYRRWWAGA
ncbi:MAG TPA: phage gp6-like head-tail connector protein [Kribbellaceae bacterium]|nr:phage gp6-like head-tail connector protein [Kribbellaceae bacterium]